MKKLLKLSSLNSDMEYYEMIADSLTNGQRTQAHSLFKAMPKANRIAFLKSATTGNWQSGIPSFQLDQLFELI